MVPDARMTLPPGLTLIICLEPVESSTSTPEMVLPFRIARTTFVFKVNLKFDIALASGKYDLTGPALSPS